MSIRIDLAIKIIKYLFMDNAPKKKTKLQTAKTIWLDDETASMWEKLSTPDGGYFNVPSIARDAIKKRLKEVAESNKCEA